MEVSASYLAGLLDAKGNVWLKRRGNHTGRQPTIQITHKTREMLDAVSAVYGGVVRAEKPTGSSKVGMYRWIVVHSDAYKVAEVVAPYVINKAGAIKAIADYGKTARRGRPSF